MRIAICGSMAFSKKMLEVGKKLNEKGHYIVLPKFTEDYARLNSTEQMHSEAAKNKVEHDLIRNYFKEIKKCNSILVVNEERHGIKGYVGGNSLIEMSFALVLGKKIFLLNEIPELSYSDEIKAMKPIILNRDLNKVEWARSNGAGSKKSQVF